MTALENFKNFFLKKYYNVDNPDISLYHFHPQIRVYLMINGIFFKNKDSLKRLILPVLNTMVILLAIAFEIMFVYRGMVTKDYAFASECFCYIMILGTVPTVYTSIIYNREVIMQQLDEMNHDFVTISKMGDRYKEPFIKNQLFIWKMCWAWQIFVLIVCTLYIFNTFALLIYQSLFASQNENTVRPLIFPMWLPKDDPYRTPNYEIFMCFEIFIIIIIEQSFCAYVYLQFHILLHYNNMMDMMILHFEVLFDDLDESVRKLPKNAPQRINVQKKLNQRFGRIANWHTSVFRCIERVSSVFGPPLVYQTTFSSMGICIMAYQVVHQLENNKIDYLFAVLLIATCLQLWIPCYLGTLIQEKAFSVGEACYECGWYKSSLAPMARSSIITIILRSQIPLTISLYSILPPLTLETYSSLLSTAYSYFNMLRQSTM